MQLLAIEILAQSPAGVDVSDGAKRQARLFLEAAMAEGARARPQMCAAILKGKPCYARPVRAPLHTTMTRATSSGNTAAQ